MKNLDKDEREILEEALNLLLKNEVQYSKNKFTRRKQMMYDLIREIHNDRSFEFKGL